MNKTISPDVCKMLSDIFRLIVKEIETDEDKETLAPGELGVSYTEGTIYIKNPHTGELFTPNSVEHIRHILSKYDPVQNTLNADYISGVRYYTSLAQLEKVSGLTFTMDTIIRQMVSPSILICSIKTDNPSILNYPSEEGILEIKKLSNEYVKGTFIDVNHFIEYIMKYDLLNHQFIGWYTSDKVPDKIKNTTGTTDRISVSVDGEIRDLDIITLRTTMEVNATSTISVNGSNYEPIVDANGNRITTVIPSNNIIMLIRDELNSCWVLTNTQLSTSNNIITLLNSRVSNIVNELDYQKRDFDQKIEELASRPGTLITHTSTYTARTDGVVTIPVPNYICTIDKLVINYNQTILRFGIDYIANESDNSITLINNIALKKSDSVQLIVIKQYSSEMENNNY